MPHDLQHTHTAFQGARRLASGSLAELAVAVLRAGRRPDATAPLIFNDFTGDQVELDLRGSEQDVRARHAAAPVAANAPVPDAPVRARGRPRLGVTAREVTLLPQHWDWLAAQPGGASVALRKLVHQAMRFGSEHERIRRAQERSYRVMVALAGDRPGFEEAARALFAADVERLRSTTQAWPRDVREHVLRLADPEYHPVLPLAG